MNAIYERVQMLLKPAQKKTLRQIAIRQGKSVAEVTRQAIDLGLAVMNQEDEIIKRQRALDAARQMRQSMALINVDVVSDLHTMRRERDA